MKKLLAIVVLGLLFTNNLSAKIVFRVICEAPQGKGVGASTNTVDNKTRYDGFKDDGYPDNDVIELIYDNNNPNQIQRIWGKDNESIKLDAYNEHFYHWRLFKPNYANGFYWGDWSFSLPDLMMIWTKGFTSKDGLGSGITSTTLYSKCKRIN
jgi:hypothetical protein